MAPRAVSWPPPAPDLTAGACNTSYYKFQLSSAGRPSKLKLVRNMPAGWWSTGVAASQGGGTFAYTAVHCATHNNIKEGVIGITGQAGNRSWTYGIYEDHPSSLAVSADGPPSRGSSKSNSDTTLIGCDLRTGTSVRLKIHPTFQLFEGFGTEATW